MRFIMMHKNDPATEAGTPPPMELVQQINSPRFRLHLDLCHIYCSERDMPKSLARAAPYARYLHVSDAQMGCNLKITKAPLTAKVDLDFADWLVYYPMNGDFLLLDRLHPLYFHDRAPDAAQRSVVQAAVKRAGIDAPPGYVNYNELSAGPSELDDEVFTYLISVPGISFDVLERAHPIITYLRSTKDESGRLLMDRRVANTLTGIVHFHEIPGEGTLDFAACFKALTDNGFSGYASVELYHHIANWEQALADSYRHLSQFV